MVLTIYEIILCGYSGEDNSTQINSIMLLATFKHRKLGYLSKHLPSLFLFRQNRFIIKRAPYHCIMSNSAGLWDTARNLMDYIGI